MSVWTLDPMHSEVIFKAKHLVISTVTGRFQNFEVTLTTDEDEEFNRARIAFEADVKSISTNNDQRDTHLRSADFFNVKKYPKMTFTSQVFMAIDDRTFGLMGDLTIKDVTKKVELTAEFGGVVRDSYGNLKAGFDLIGELNRKDFNLTWDALTEAGGVIVSDVIKLEMHIQLIKQE